jgi:nucleoside-diphosphate-sugar epimerase
LNDDGRQRRDFTFVADAVDAALLAALHGERGDTFNIGTGTSVSVLRALDILRSVGCTVRVDQRERQCGEARDTCADITRARQELGYTPAWSIEDGLHRQACWQRELAGEEADLVGPTHSRLRPLRT